MTSQRTVVRAIPSHDVVLRLLVQRATVIPPESAGELTARLKPFFPRVAVFERQISGERGLYVYRDGRFEPQAPPSWWDAPDIPCVRVSPQTGKLVSVTGSWAALMHASPADLIGRHFLDFVKPEAHAVAGAMFQALQTQGEVRSEAVVQRPDDTTLLIEFRAVRRDVDIEVCYRPIERAELDTHD